MDVELRELQTLPELAVELRRNRCLAAYLGNRLVGALRSTEDGRAPHIARLSWHLICRARASVQNRTTHDEVLAGGVIAVHLRKSLATHGTATPA